MTVPEEIFARLRAMLLELHTAAIVTKDGPSEFALGQPSAGPPKFLAAVYLKSSDVKFHLFPVYERPELLEELSPELRKRMQGKSCFNFRKIDEEIFDQLEVLVARAMRDSTE